MPIKVATSLIQGQKASIALAEKAILIAMKKAQLQRANGVFLILSTHFSAILHNTILAVANHAQCTQVFGCSATGFFTEEDWVLDCPAVAVMVFGEDVHIQLAENAPLDQEMLTLAAPNAAHYEWLNNGAIRYGGISGDANGQEKCTVWQNAKGDQSGHVEAYFSGVLLHSAASHGLTMLCEPAKISASQRFDVISLDDMSALKHLKFVWENYAHTNNETSLPQHHIMAVYAENLDALLAGEYAQTSLISLNEAQNSVTLAEALSKNQVMAWALRDPKNAQTDLVRTTNKLLKESAKPPAFGLMFSSIARGPFDDGIDHELNIVTHMLNNIPLLGFYGNGTLMHIGKHNQLLPYSIVLNLYSEK